MMTVVCQVDDLKVAQKKPLKWTKYSLYSSKIYKEKLMVHRVKVHDYLYMDFD